MYIHLKETLVTNNKYPITNFYTTTFFPFLTTIYLFQYLFITAMSIGLFQEKFKQGGG